MFEQTYILVHALALVHELHDGSNGRHSVQVLGSVRRAGSSDAHLPGVEQHGDRGAHGQMFLTALENIGNLTKKLFAI